MTDFQKIKYYDLVFEGLKNRLPFLIGRTNEQERLVRILTRSIHNNCLIVGTSGIGKTTFVRSFAKLFSEKNPFVEITPDSFYALSRETNNQFINYQESLSRLPKTTLFIDDFGTLVHGKPHLFEQIFRLLKPLLVSPRIKVILNLQPTEQSWIQNEEPAFSQYFENITLKPQSTEELINILSLHLSKLNKFSKIAVNEKILAFIVSTVGKFNSINTTPRALLKILDESLIKTTYESKNELTEDEVLTIISGLTGISKSQLTANGFDQIKSLNTNLGKGIVGQSHAISKISQNITRAKLGLKNPNRPLGSFLLLGPSGVGKTETAKIISQTLFNQDGNFIRIDMSEFAQEHSVQKLIGAPPGYIGFDIGGSLTEAVKNEPHSLILLDEIEKAHPKIFDIFLQILDDARLTSGQSETIDFRHTILIATSNIGINQIIEAYNNKIDVNSDSFYKNYLLPLLTNHFRLEFLNRFDSIIIFKPLSPENLLNIAKLEIKKVEERVKHHNISFNVDPNILINKIQQLADPRFGARPVKRFIEEICETLITKKLLEKHAQKTLTK